MRFLMAPVGSAGDVHPVVGVGLELRRLGHEVVFAVNGYFKEMIVERGFGFIEIGTAEEFRAVTDHPDIWNPRRALTHLYRNGVVKAMRLQQEVTADFCRAKGSVSLTGILGFGGLLAGERHGVPVATMHLQPAAIWSRIDPPKYQGMVGPRWLKSLVYDLAERFMMDPAILPTFNAYRAELGLAPIRGISRWWHSRDAVFCFFPSWFAAKPADWPPATEVLDFPLWEEGADRELDPAVEAFLSAGAAPIVFTPGSANVFGRTFFETAVRATRELGARCVLLSRFPEQMPKDLGKDCLAHSYASFTKLLPRARALVHHGGIGSAAQALAAGIPQLIMALAHDQFDNGERVRRLGVGDWLTKADFTSRRVARRLGRLVRDPAVAARAREVAIRLRARDGAARCAAAVEAWAKRRTE